MKKKKILYIDKEGFCNFYFDDKEIYYDAVYDLIKYETISLVDYLNDIGFIRSCIILNPKVVEDKHKSEIDEETGDFEIEGPNDFYELKFKKKLKGDK